MHDQHDVQSAGTEATDTEEFTVAPTHVPIASHVPVEPARAHTVPAGWKHTVNPSRPGGHPPSGFGYEHEPTGVGADSMQLPAPHVPGLFPTVVKHAVPAGS